MNRLFKKIAKFIFVSVENRISYKARFFRASFKERCDMVRPSFYHLGDNVELHTFGFGTEPYLISIDDNVCVAAEVRFITHDVSCFRMAHYLGIPKNSVDKVGCIKLKDNCYIGAWSILMPNVTVGRNSVVAAGSVVTKNIPDGEVWGGNPAKFIMKVDDYANKVKTRSQEFPWMKNKEKMTKDQIVKMRQDFFFNNGENNSEKL